MVECIKLEMFSHVKTLCATIAGGELHPIGDVRVSVSIAVSGTQGPSESSASTPAELWFRVDDRRWPLALECFSLEFSSQAQTRVASDVVGPTKVPSPVRDRGDWETARHRKSSYSTMSILRVLTRRLRLCIRNLGPLEDLCLLMALSSTFSRRFLAQCKLLSVWIEALCARGQRLGDLWHLFLTIMYIHVRVGRC